MSGSIFVLSLAALLAVLVMRNKITEYINKNFGLSFKFQSEWIVYILTIFFIIVITLGMLMDTQSSFGQLTVGGSIEKLEPAPGKPHRWFDINFDIFK